MSPVSNPPPPGDPGPRVHPTDQARDIGQAAGRAVWRILLGYPAQWFVALCALLLIGLLALRGHDLAGAWPVLVVGWGSGLVTLILVERFDDDPLRPRERDPELHIALGLLGVVGWALLPALIALVV